MLDTSSIFYIDLLVVPEEGLEPSILEGTRF